MAPVLVSVCGEVMVSWAVPPQASPTLLRSMAPALVESPYRVRNALTAPQPVMSRLRWAPADDVVDHYSRRSLEGMEERFFRRQQDCVQQLDIGPVDGHLRGDVVRPVGGGRQVERGMAYGVALDDESGYWDAWSADRAFG